MPKIMCSRGDAGGKHVEGELCCERGKWGGGEGLVGRLVSHSCQQVRVGQGVTCARATVSSLGNRSEK